MLTEIEFNSPVPTTGRLGGRGAGPAPALHPRGYKVEVSQDGKSWGSKPVAQGTGTGAHTFSTFAPVRAKFVRITQTGTAQDAPGWSVGNVKLYEAGSAGTTNPGTSEPRNHQQGNTPCPFRPRPNQS